MKSVVCSVFFLSIVSVISACVSSFGQSVSEEDSRHANPFLDGSDIDSLYGETSKIWLGSVDFLDFWCGIPQSSYIDHESTNTARRRRREGHNPEAHPVIDLNTYSLDHSYVYFRGRSFEFGPGRQLVYSRGGVGREVSKECPTEWRYKGESACSLQQAEALATSYEEQYGSYHLIFNNCHNFAEWLMQKLVSNDCLP